MLNSNMLKQNVLRDKLYVSLPLLFWQYLVLSALAGVFYTVFSFYAVFCLLLLCFFTVLYYRHMRIFRTVLLITVFFLAFLYTNFRQPVQTIDSIQYYTQNFDPMEERNFCGTVENVQGASDRRLRITLSHVHITEGKSCTHSGKTLQGNVLYTWDRAFGDRFRPVAGQILQIKAKLRPFYGSLKEYYNRKNIWYGAWNYGAKNSYSIQGEGNALAILRENLRYSFANFLFREEFAEKFSYVIKSAEAQAKAVCMALLFGDKFYLSQQTLDDFNAANLLHSLALSGQHLSLVGVLAFWVLLLVQFTKPRLYEWVSRPMLAVYTGFILGFLYCWLGAAPYSLLRAYAMLLVAAFFYIKAKEITLLDLLFYALFFFLVLDPLSLFDLGVQLSFICVFVIAYLLPFLRWIYDRFFCSIREPWDTFLFSICSLLIVSCAIQLIIAPLIILYFGRVSWFFILNVLWLPFLTFWVMPLVFLAFLCMAFPFANFLLDLAVFPVAWSIEGLHVLFSEYFYPFVQCLRPMGLEFIGFYLLLFIGLYALKGKKRISALFMLIGMICLFLPVFIRVFAERPNLLVAMLDVGQGQAIYIQTEKKRVLFDTGGTNSVRFNVGRDIVAKYLTENQCSYLDIVIASHDDSDHINGIRQILRTFSVGTYYESAVSVSKKSTARTILDRELEQQKMPMHVLGTGDYIELGNGYGLNILYPPKIGLQSNMLKNNTILLDAKSLSNNNILLNNSILLNKNSFSEKGKRSLTLALKKYSSNNSSVVALLQKNGKGLMLLCADSENEVLERLTAYYGKALHAEVLVLPHHGSGTSYNENFYKAVSPREVIASCGVYNHWGFPSKKICAFFAGQGITVRTTANEGHISFIHDGDKFLETGKIFLQELYSIL